VPWPPGCAALGPQDDETAHDEGTGHHHRREQVRLDRLAEQQAQQDGRQKSDRHVGRAKRCAWRWVGSATSVSRIFCQYTMITARIAPVWMAMSNTLALASSRPSSAPARIRCPVDDIGRNSVSPSTMPMIAALTSNTISTRAP
jgi:hypothetical protein